MGTYAIIVTIIYVLGVLGLGVATLALLLNGIREHNYPELARRLMAIAGGAIASGVALIPIYRLLAVLAEGAKPLSPRSLVLGGVLPALTGAAIGFLANKLLRERSSRSVRLLILLNASFGTYMLIGLAGLYTITQSTKLTDRDLKPSLEELRESASSLDRSIELLEGMAHQTSRSLQQTEKLSEDVESEFKDLRDELGESARELAEVGQHTSYPYNWAQNVRRLSNEMANASLALREAARSHGVYAGCGTDEACLDTLLIRISRVAKQSTQLSQTIRSTSANIARDQEKQVERAVLAIFPNLIFMMGAFIVITLSKD